MHRNVLCLDVRRIHVANGFQRLSTTIRLISHLAILFLNFVFFCNMHTYQWARLYSRSSLHSTWIRFNGRSIDTIQTHTHKNIYTHTHTYTLDVVFGFLFFNVYLCMLFFYFYYIYTLIDRFLFFFLLVRLDPFRTFLSNSDIDHCLVFIQYAIWHVQTLWTCEFQCVVQCNCYRCWHSMLRVNEK